MGFGAVVCENIHTLVNCFWILNEGGRAYLSTGCFSILDQGTA